MNKAIDKKFFDIQFFGEEGGGTDGNTEPKPKELEGDPKPVEKTFTQADLDKIVKDRLEKERKKYDGFEELKAKASKFDEMENKRLEEAGKYQELLDKKDASHKDELKKLQEKLDAMEAERKAKELYSLKKSMLAKVMKVGEDKVSDDMIGFIQGNDEKTINANVEVFSKLLPSIKTTDGGGNPVPPAKNPPKNEPAVEQVLKDVEYESKMMKAQKAFFGE